MEKAISVSGLSVSYEKQRVLRNIYFQLDQGRIYGVLGPNGAGKSTLFKSILELIKPNSGDIKIFGQELNDVRKRVAYIPQKDAVDWDFPATVMDIALMGRYPHKTLLQRLSAEDHKIARNALEKLGIADLADRQIGALSGGQQQRVFIARALSQNPDLILLDEPFVGVDITTESKIIQVLKDLAAKGKTFLVVHHDLSQVRKYFDGIILLNRRLIAFGDVDTAFTQENIELAYGSQSDILYTT